jgi:site-specific recombinase XerD
VTIIDLPTGACEPTDQGHRAETCPVGEPSRGMARTDELAQLGDAARGYLRDSRAPATVRAYRQDWGHFTAWCDRLGLEPLPAAPHAVVGYLTAYAGDLSCASLQRRLTSISQAHKAAGYDDPPTRHRLVRRAWEGIRRVHGREPNRKAPLRSSDIRALVATCDTTRLGGLRDRALLVLGFAGAFRRSELVALDVADIEWIEAGLTVTIRRSKTDQEGKGARVGILFGSDPATCPVRTLRAWLDTAGVTEGPVFRQVDRFGNMGGRLTGKSAAERVKVACTRAGLNADRYGGHSLRAGLITDAIENGATEQRTMQHSRHKSVHVFRTYVRDLNLHDASNPLRVVGL